MAEMQLMVMTTMSSFVAYARMVVPLPLSPGSPSNWEFSTSESISASFTPFSCCRLFPPVLGSATKDVSTGRYISVVIHSWALTRKGRFTNPFFLTSNLGHWWIKVFTNKDCYYWSFEENGSYRVSMRRQGGWISLFFRAHLISYISLNRSHCKSRLCSLRRCSGSAINCWIGR